MSCVYFLNSLILLKENDVLRVFASKGFPEPEHATDIIVSLEESAIFSQISHL
jgi:hypothetical protein